MKLLSLLLVAGAGLVVLVWLCWTWGEPALWPHRWTIVNAFDGKVDPTAGGKYRFDCGSLKCETFLPRLPPATRVCCVQRLIESGTESGACCLAYFGDQYRSEIHIFRQADGSYTINPTVPFCRNANYDRFAKEPVRRQSFIPCFERWGVEAPPWAATWPS